MPLYTYKCNEKTCKVDLVDLQRKIAEREEPVECDECGELLEFTVGETGPGYGKHGSWAAWRMDQNWR